MGNVLVRFSARQHARRESISKRAPSTTRTSLRFRIKNLRAVRFRLSHTPAISHPFLDHVCIAWFEPYNRARRRTVSDLFNVPRSLTAYLLEHRIDVRTFSIGNE
jgi:hypothetical protein